MRRIAFINEKGGTCKTTLAVNVAAYFAKNKGQKVLLVDTDTQGHAGKSLGLDVRAISPNVFHLLSDASVALQDVTHPTSVNGLFVIPAYKQMGEFPVAVAQHADRARKLETRIKQAEAEGYDAVIFDAPPSMGLTTTNILVAAEEVVIPVALTYLSLDGCAEMVRTVESISSEYEKPSLHVSRVVPTLYRKTALADEILEKLKSYFPKELSTPLGMNVKIDEAQSHGQTIWEYAPWSRGAQMLETIAEEVFKANAGSKAGTSRGKAVA